MSKLGFVVYTKEKHRILPFFGVAKRLRGNRLLLLPIPLNILVALSFKGYRWAKDIGKTA